MRCPKRHRLLLFLTAGGALFQSTCFLESDFDPETLLAESASTFLTDAIFFALDAFLFSLT